MSSLYRSSYHVTPAYSRCFFVQLKFHDSGKLKRMVVTQGNHRADAVPQLLIRFLGDAPTKRPTASCAIPTTGTVTLTLRWG